MKVHASPLPNSEERTLRAISDLLMGRAAPEQPGTFLSRMPLPLAYAKCLPPFSVFSSVLTVNVNTLNTAGTNTTVQVVDCVGEHALLTLPSRSLSNLLGELNRVSMDAALFHALATPSTASRDFCWVDNPVVGGVVRETTFSTGLSFNQAYWWTDLISTPISALQAERFSRDWLALADVEGANFFYGKVPVDMPEEVVDLVAGDDAGGLAPVPVAALCPRNASDMMAREELCAPEGEGVGGVDGRMGEDEVEEGGMGEEAVPSTLPASSTDVSSCRL